MFDILQLWKTPGQHTLQLQVSHFEQNRPDGWYNLLHSPENIHLTTCHVHYNVSAFTTDGLRCLSSPWWPTPWTGVRPTSPRCPWGTAAWRKVLLPTSNAAFRAHPYLLLTRMGQRLECLTLRERRWVHFMSNVGGLHISRCTYCNFAQYYIYNLNAN